MTDGIPWQHDARHPFAHVNLGGMGPLQPALVLGWTHINPSSPEPPYWRATVLVWVDDAPMVTVVADRNIQPAAPRT